MASTALPHERGHGIANAVPWFFVFIAVSPPRATAPRPDLGAAPRSGRTRCAAGRSDRYTEQGCQVAPPSSWIRSSGAPHRYGALPTTRRALCLHGRVRRQAGRSLGVARGQAAWPRWGGCLPVRSRRQRAVGACAERGRGLRAEAGADRGGGSEFLCCSIACSLLISRVIRSWPAVSFSTLRVICS